MSYKEEIVVLEFAKSWFGWAEGEGVSERLESPIEYLLFWSLSGVALDEGHEIRWDLDCVPHEVVDGELMQAGGGAATFTRTGGLSPSRLVIAPQVKIESYRADLVLRGERVDTDRSALLVVECDGHDYHEKTKAQARRDKKRDRRFTALGLDLLRFTGSEIWRAPRDCARECIEFLTKKGAL